MVPGTTNVPAGWPVSWAARVLRMGAQEPASGSRDRRARAVPRRTRRRPPCPSPVVCAGARRGRRRAAARRSGYPGRGRCPGRPGPACRTSTPARGQVGSTSSGMRSAATIAAVHQVQEQGPASPGSPPSAGGRQASGSRPCAWSSIVTVSGSTHVCRAGHSERRGPCRRPRSTAARMPRSIWPPGPDASDAGDTRTASLPASAPPTDPSGVRGDDHQGHGAPGPGDLGDPAHRRTARGVGQGGRGGCRKDDRGDRHRLLTRAGTRGRRGAGDGRQRRPSVASTRRGICGLGNVSGSCHGASSRRGTRGRGPRDRLELRSIRRRRWDPGRRLWRVDETVPGR